MSGLDAHELNKHGLIVCMTHEGHLGIKQSLGKGLLTLQRLDTWWAEMMLDTWHKPSKSIKHKGR